MLNIYINIDHIIMYKILLLLIGHLLVFVFIFFNKESKLVEKRVKENFASDDGLSAQLCCESGKYGDKSTGCKLCPDGTTSIPYGSKGCSNTELSSCKSCSDIHNACWVLNTSNKTCQPQFCSSGKTCVLKTDNKKGYIAGQCYNLSTP